MATQARFGVRPSNCATDVFADERSLLVWLEIADLIEIAAALVTCRATKKVLAAHTVRQQRPNQRGNRPARWRCPPIERRNSRMRRVALIPAEQLVSLSPDSTTVTCRRAISERPSRDRGRVAERLVEMRDQVVDDRQRVRFDHELVMVGVKVARDDARRDRVRRIEDRRSRRKRPHRPARCFDIKPTTTLESILPDRNAPSGTRHQMGTHGVAQHLAQVLDRLLLRPLLRCGQFQ